MASFSLTQAADTLAIMATRVRSYSKINLGLAIGPVRADGFHGLTTLYQTLDLHDVVTVSARAWRRALQRGFL